MSLILYEMAHSPFCIPISQALTACGIAFERKEIPNWDRSELLRLTDGAYYSVPVLQHDERIIYESSGHSQDIARYVDTTFADLPRMERTGRRAASVAEMVRGDA